MSRSLELMAEACTGLVFVTKRMFGGHAFYAPNGGMFAGIVTDDEVVLKFELGAARDELIALGGHPWIYPGRDKPTTMKEWIVIPEAFYDDLETLHVWLKRAHGLIPPKAPKAPKTPKPSKAERATKKKAGRVQGHAKTSPPRRKTATKATKRSHP